MERKNVIVGEIYKIQYKWGQVWRNGWGRLDESNHVAVITEDNGVSIVPNDLDIIFVYKISNIK